MNAMSYKGYEAVVAYDADADLFHGEVVNTRDVITFQGRSVDELKSALADSVEDYLAFCRERGEDPERPDGFLTILGGADEVVNVAGHRLSTGGMEQVVASHPDVAECAVLAAKDEIKGEQPCAFIVLKAGVTRPNAEIEKEVVKLVRDKIGPVAAFKIALVVSRLPKTRSGKILRGTMKKIADHDTWATPAAIEDPKVLDEIEEALATRAG